MTKFQSQLGLELKLLFRSPVLLLIQFLFAGTAAYTFEAAASSTFSNLYERAYSFHSVAQSLSVGIAVQIGILMIRRDIRRPSFEWSRSLPLSFGMLLAAKFTAGMAYLSVFTIAAAALFAGFSAGEGIAGPVYMGHALHFAGMYEVSYAITLALAMLLAVAIPNRVVYLIGFCAWMFGTFFMEQFIIYRYQLYALKVFHLSQLFIENGIGGEKELWGYRIMDEERLLSNLFVLSFVLLLLTASAAVLNKQRPTFHFRRSLLVAGSAALLVVAAYIPYGIVWKERFDSYNSKLLDPNVPTFDEARLDRSSFAVRGYDIKLEKGKKDLLKGTAVLDIAVSALHNQTEINLTLNRAFQVRSVSIQGKETSYTRLGDFIRFSLPKPLPTSISVTVDYEGTLMDFQKRRGSEFYNAFVKEHNVLLPSYIGWYPLPGKQPVYLRDSPSSVVAGPTYFNKTVSLSRFRLRAIGFGPKLYSSLPQTVQDASGQTFEGSAAANVNLIGGQLVEVRSSSIPAVVITTPYYEKSARDQLKLWERQYAYFHSWLPSLEQSPIREVLFVGDHYNLSSWWFNSNRSTSLFMDPGVFFQEDNKRAEGWMNRQLLGVRTGDYLIEDTRSDVRIPLRALFWYLYYREEMHLTERQIRMGEARSIMLDGLNDGSNDPDQIGLKMKDQVEAALQRGRNEEVKQVLKRMYERGLEIPDLETEETAKSAPISYADWMDVWKQVMGNE
ncbi:ABC transporter permease [Paenibacillus caui]|uniref:ABC transporter permease n=1 Tax=Paenibacillus caui TaxID=2873927 RepID=UPI001CA997C2|nr:hypothetical protein [Paenibacillus caui]